MGEVSLYGFISFFLQNYIKIHWERLRGKSCRLECRNFGNKGNQGKAERFITGEDREGNLEECHNWDKMGPRAYDL